MPTSGPTTRRSHPISDDLQGDVIDAPEGEETMLVTMITSMAARCGGAVCAMGHTLDLDDQDSSRSCKDFSCLDVVVSWSRDLCQG